MPYFQYMDKNDRKHHRNTGRVGWDQSRASGGCLIAMATLPLTVVLAALGIRRPARKRP